VGKAYTAAGQTGHAFILWLYYRHIRLTCWGTWRLIRELRQATDLSLRETKETARAIWWSMISNVASERHFWLNLSEIKDK